MSRRFSTEEDRLLNLQEAVSVTQNILPSNEPGPRQIHALPVRRVLGELPAHTDESVLAPVRNDHVPLDSVASVLQALDIRGKGLNPPEAVKFPFEAEALHSRLLQVQEYERASPLGRLLRRARATPRVGSLSRRHSISGALAPTARPSPRPWRLNPDELLGLLEPVLAAMRRRLNYVQHFSETLSSLGGPSHSERLDLTVLRNKVLKLFGYWPHDVIHNDPAYASDLPTDLSSSLYYSGRVWTDEMAENLTEQVLDPGWESVRTLQGVVNGLKGVGRGDL